MLQKNHSGRREKSDAQLEQALACHQNGDLETAYRLYSEILSIDSGNVDALHFSGVLAHQRYDSEGEFDPIVFERALEKAQEPFDFERKLYALMEDPAGKLRALAPFAMIRRALSHYGATVRKHGSIPDLLPGLEE